MRHTSMPKLCHVNSGEILCGVLSEERDGVKIPSGVSLVGMWEKAG